MTIQQTTPDEAYKLLQAGYVYIDVRTEPEFADGHPVTAVNVPIGFPDPATQQMRMNPQFLEVVTAHFGRDAKIVVGCRSGARSQRAAELLSEAGFVNVVNMQGGFTGLYDQTGHAIVLGWSKRNLPVCESCAPEHAYSHLSVATGT